MFKDKSNRDTGDDWGISTVKTPFFNPQECPVTTLGRPWEMMKLVEEFRAAKPQTVVEIGTFNGGSLWHWLKNAEPGCRIASIDPLGDPSCTGSPEQFYSWVPDHVLYRFFQTSSHEPATVEQVMAFLGVEQIDWLFIDGDHQYSSAYRDFTLWGPLVRPGGIICIHDLRPLEWGPAQLWNEIQGEGYLTREYIADVNQNNAGVGVIYVESNDGRDS
jgi:hypothetical protein